MRHAWAGERSSDPEEERTRSLKPEGRKTAEVVAKWLADNLDEPPTTIFVSPFQRTIETGDIVGRVLNEERGTDIRVNAVGDMAPDRPLTGSILELAGQFGGSNDRILLVGHGDNLPAAFDALPNKDGDDFPDLKMAMVVAVKMKRKSGKWRVKWTLRPSDIGRPDHT